MQNTPAVWTTASIFFFAFTLVLYLTGSAGAQEKQGKQKKTAKQFLDEIDRKIPQLLRDFSVPGAAIGIIEDGEIVLQKGYGFSDVERQAKVTANTGFNIASISKTVAAWGVMKLVQEGRIDLDAPAEKYLSRWHLPGSKFDSNEVTIKRLLSHTAGLSLHGYPGWSPTDELPTIEESLNGKNNGPGRVEIIMEPGTKYKYSGGGFSILQLIIEEVTGQKFEDYMQAEILEPLGMNNSSYKIDEKIMAASSFEHDNFGEKIDFERFAAQAAAGLHTNIEDFTRFATCNLYRIQDFEKHNRILSSETLKQMMTPVPQAAGRYGYGLGFSTESIPGTSVVLRGHGGANSGWHSILRLNPETNDGFIMVTNGGAGQRIYFHIFSDWVHWQTGVRLEDWHKAKPSIANQLKAIIEDGNTDDIAAIYTDLKKNRPEDFDFSESQLNELGYHYIAKDDLEKAIAVLKLNVQAFPKAFNTYDSLGEALLKQGAREAAIKNYKKSVELNPLNKGGIKVLNELGVSTDELIKKADVDPYFSETESTSSNTGPQTITRNILQDSQGGFWLATWNGIVRYDGTTFTNVTNKEGLRRYRAFSLLEDNEQHVWIGTVGGAGVYRFDGDTYTNFTTKDGLVHNSVVSMLQDSDNNIWFGSMGVTKYDGKTFTSFTKEDGFTNSDVNSISQAPDGSIWFGTRGALFHYDGKTFVNFTEKHGISFPGYVPTVIDRKGHLWFGGENGVYYYDGETVQHVFKSPSYSLFEDSKGNIWFSGGTLADEMNQTRGISVLNRFDPASGLKNILTTRKRYEIKNGMIFGLSEDKDGSIWFGTGGGVGRIEGDTVRYY